MLLHRNLERLLGTALVDGEFLANLLISPRAAAAGFDLSPEELEALPSANAGSLEELAAHIQAWITNTPRRWRTSAHRSTVDMSQSARLAM